MTFAKSYEPGEYESDIYAAWEASGIFEPSIAKYPVDSDGDGMDDRAHLQSLNTFSIVMPPPNANGNLHIGHGLTVALEDSLTRYYRLRGDSSWYIPGADHAGFETWVVYERELEKHGHTRFEFSRDDLYAKVWDFVAEQRGNMELQLRALGASCSWGDLTFTLDENVVDRVYTTFEKMWNDGMIYRGEKLVNFCPKHRTAFADIEVEHKDEKGTLWDIKYEVVDETEANHSQDDSSKENSQSPREIIISTTRPETLFGDTAVAVNPDDERYVGLVGKFVKLPLTDKIIPIITDEHADPEYGTGAVKITPAHDFDDFEVGERHNLPRVQVISEEGRMVNVPEEYDGLTTEECRKKVLRDLKAQDLLVGEKKIVHSVAHCYKCGTVLEPMLKEQWFIDVEKLAKVAIEHLEAGEIKFHPENKGKVLINYLRGLKDWNISRQIPWGIAIPMFRKVDDEATDEPDWIFDRRTHLTEIEKAGVRYVRDADTFDTWFSSAHWPIVCTNWTEENFNPYYPLNVMETGADILFAWVARMIMMGLYVTGEVPFREVYLHGLVLDAHGKKMSKSKGNVINPMELVTRFGSDAFRLGILRGRSAGMNQAFSENSVIAGRNLCNKLWNISRLVQSIIDDEAGTYLSRNAYTTLNMGEDWICREINECLDNVEKCMKDYRFAEAIEVLYSTIWDKYADWFLESQKIFKNKELLKTTLETLLIALHPFAPFVTEAIWQNLSWTDGFVASQNWPNRLEYDTISAEEFTRLMSVVSEVRGTLQALPGTNNTGKYGLLYGEDSLINDNQMLIRVLTKVPTINSLDGAPRGLRLALANHEVYLDVPADVVAKYREVLTEKILAVGRELDGLNMRMMNPNYVERAPEHLVKETRDAISEKEALIARLKQQLELI
ncbi:valine--tRNA ligase [Candidatus Saccharibacteria bacterium]|nr:valine--tRNA ligase [Candidatus Saccharibacteria bacterium]